MFTTTENLNKTWKITVNSKKEGYIENIKDGGTVTFKLGDNGIRTTSNSEIATLSVLKKANSMAKKIYNKLNLEHQFSWVYGGTNKPFKLEQIK